MSPTCRVCGQVIPKGTQCWIAAVGPVDQRGITCVPCHDKEDS